jgi:hypothetical protein
LQIPEMPRDEGRQLDLTRQNGNDARANAHRAPEEASATGDRQKPEICASALLRSVNGQALLGSAPL